MKLSEIVAKLTGLESQVAADKFKGELAELQSAVKSTITSLESALATARASIESLGKAKADAEATVALRDASLSEVSTKLSEVLTGLKVEVKADATNADKILALETFAKVAGEKAGGIPADKIPAPGVKAEGKKLARSEFEKLSPSAKTQFFKDGGKLTD